MPTMRTPSKITDHLIVYSCMRSALIEAMKSGHNSIVVPAFGGGAGQIPAEAIAHHMRLAWDQKGNLLPIVSVNTGKNVSGDFLVYFGDYRVATPVMLRIRNGKVSPGTVKVTWPYGTFNVSVDGEYGIGLYPLDMKAKVLSASYQGD